MALFPFARPKWRHKDPEIRLRALREETALPPDDLAGLLASDPDPRVRAAACGRIDDPAVLQELAPDLDGEGRTMVVERLRELRQQELMRAPADQRAAILDTIDDPVTLEMVATTADRYDRELRCLAVERLDDQEALFRVLTAQCGKEVGLAALKRLDDPDLLARAVEEGGSRAVRARARERLHTLRPDETVPATETAETILEQARALVREPIAKAWEQWPAIEARFAALAATEAEQRNEMAAIGDRLTAAWHDEEDRRKGVVFEAQQRLRARERLAAICRELEVLWNKPWQEQEAARLIAEWEELVGEAGFVAENLRRQFAHCRKILARNQEALGRERQQEQALLALRDSIAAAIAKERFAEARSSLRDLEAQTAAWKPRFLSEHDLAREVKDLAAALAAAEEEQHHRRQQALESARRERRDLLAAMAACIEDPAPAARREDFDRLWERRSNLSPVPRNEEKEFFEQCAALRARFREAVRDSLDREDWKRWQNKNLKEELIAEVAALAEKNDMPAVFAAVKAARARWREIGPVPKKEAQEQWRRFDAACEEQFARCVTFFEEQDERARRNLEAKTELCHKAAALEESTAWKETAAALRGLQARWKELGRIGKEDDSELYAAFRASCDRFFSRRQEFFAAQDKKRQKNAEAKERLIIRAERIAAARQEGDKKNIIALQREWKAAGPAPRDAEEDLWQRFRSACDKYFSWLDTLRPQNLEKKTALCEEVERLCADCTPETVDQVRQRIIELQKQWKRIGPVPEDDHEAVTARFRAPIDAFFEARRREQEEIDRERPQNEARKEALLARLDEFVTANNAASVAGIIAIQEEWKGIGPATRERDRALDREFSERCNRFFKQRREAQREMDQARRQNLRAKEALCLRLEVVAGTARAPRPAPSGRGRQGLTLAEQLQLAMEANAGRSEVGTVADRRDKAEEIKKVEQEWATTGPVPREHRHLIEKRFNRALEAAQKAAGLKAGRAAPARKKEPSGKEINGENENP